MWCVHGGLSPNAIVIWMTFRILLTTETRCASKDDSKAFGRSTCFSTLQSNVGTSLLQSFASIIPSISLKFLDALVRYEFVIFDHKILVALSPWKIVWIPGGGVDTIAVNALCPCGLLNSWCAFIISNYIALTFLGGILIQ